MVMCIGTRLGEYEYSDDYTQGKIYEVIKVDSIKDTNRRPYFLIINDNESIGTWREEDLVFCFVELKEWRNQQIEKLL